MAALNFYKGNPSNTGAACGMWIKPTDGCIFIQIIKQNGWDPTKRVGRATFKGGAKVTCKFNATEIGAFLDVLARNVDYSTIHASKDMTMIHFQRYFKYDAATKKSIEPQLGYSLSLGHKTGEKTDHYRIGLTFAEAQTARVFWEFALGLIFAYQPDANEAEGETPAPVSKPPVAEAPKQSSPDDSDLL